jgi:hypothetical protein
LDWYVEGTVDFAQGAASKTDRPHRQTDRQQVEIAEKAVDDAKTKKMEKGVLLTP